ncbi:hypothetical protein PC129_g18738 [Phytophthora cactorum]|uniref:Uncharacterized protein n=1 Tax=Phytophthora cactorum TaxID=29920 RepID=A0A329S311_9STRA|nr:hypothetical protein Pcac1_g7631 [Phytophthora cactorum]KAG2801962.1 hypothetical protein PC112_g19828 [Phytophthora cactorum]KAG2817578.1 hypothetical protein PC111_g12654 [Phytophthora cactorum]KAG2849673.1 hypothetical protein PC113_g17355 [Phytophthora cactorum]KAG2886278.1 hypothetical protein PC114_g19341 [Phytophthora cactorum]
MAATAIAASTLSNSSLAHEQPTGRVLSTDQRKLFAENAQAALAKCSKLQSTRALHEPAAARRTEAVEKLRQDRRQRRLDITAVLETSHKSSLIGITATTSASVLFGSTAPCIAEPEVIEGPYYVRGEYIRTDMREQQTCVSMYADVQVIDMNMCDTVKDMYVDLVYSGVVASTNGNSADQTQSPEYLSTSCQRKWCRSDDLHLPWILRWSHYTRALHWQLPLSNKTSAGGSVV